VHALIMAEISDREKANKNHLQDLKTAHHDYSTELTALTARLQRAEDRVKDAETALKVAQQKAIKVSDSSCSVLLQLLRLLYNG
jgi:intracellular protein transport protein USO1